MATKEPIDEAQPITIKFLVGLGALLIPIVAGGIHAVNVLGDIKTEIALLRKDINVQGERIAEQTKRSEGWVHRTELRLWINALRTTNKTLDVPEFQN